MAAVGAGVIVTGVIAVTGGHPPPAGIVYVTMYDPDADVAGIIAPVAGLIVNPAGEALNTPPGVPVMVTACEAATVLQ